MIGQTVRTTVALPTELVNAVDEAIRAGRARSRNELLTTALQHELAAQARAAIDIAFGAMADDVEAQQQATETAGAFAAADWEAFQLGETER